MLRCSSWLCIIQVLSCVSIFFFFNDTAPPEIYPLPLHAALPISAQAPPAGVLPAPPRGVPPPTARPRSGSPARARSQPVRMRSTRLRRCPRSSGRRAHSSPGPRRSEEHTSELQSRLHLVCRLLLE